MGWHSPDLMDEVLLSRPGRCANRRPPGQVQLYNLQVLFELKLSGLAFVLSPGRKASKAVGSKCRAEASGQIAIYNFILMFKPELSGTPGPAFARTPDRSAAEPAGPKCQTRDLPDR